MSLYYCDTSALVKLYLPETGSQWVKEIITAQEQDGNPLHMIHFVHLAIVEAGAALSRHERMGSLTTQHRKKLFRLILRDSRIKFQTLAITETLIHRAAELTQHHPLRGYDAVHLAAALELNQSYISQQLAPIAFVSADENLNQAACAEGLTTDNPNAHP
ncbi:MAG: type II toxin-antitoxin system VapC family toxin [Chloroflexi bacterium]|nr:type II toxin-antitoxin system VapC family toxin [Chloroflexota bacterium]